MLLAARSSGDRATTTTRRRLALLPLCLGLLATVLAAAGSWIPSLWGDEAASVMSAERSLPSLFRMLGHVDAVHGAYYLGLHFWIAGFGASPFSVRMPPALAAGATVAAVVLIVRELGDERLALIAGILCCVLPRVTYMGEETRAYAFSAALTAWATWVLLRIVLEHHESRRWWLAYGLLMAAGIYAFMYVVLFAAVHALVLVAHRVGRPVARRWLITTSVTVVAAAPVVIFALLERRQVAYLSDNDNITAHSLLVGLWFFNDWFAGIAWLLIVVGLVDALRSRRRATRDVRGGHPGLPLLGLLWLTVPATLLVLGNLVFADYTDRYLSFSAPAASILMALGIRALCGQRPARVAVAVLAVIAVAAPEYVAERTPYAKNDSDWAQVSSTVAAHAHPGEAIVFDDTASPSKRPRLAMHTYPSGFAGLRDVTLRVPFQRSSTWYDRVYSVPQAEARGRFTGVTRVLLVEYAVPGHVDRWGLPALQSYGYSVQASWRTHRSRILELTRAAPVAPVTPPTSVTPP